MSFCAALFSLGVAVHLNLFPHPEFVFFAMLFVYTAQRFYKIKNHQIDIETARIKWMKAHEGVVKGILIFSFIGFVYWILPLIKVAFIPVLLIRGTILLFCAIISILYVVRIGKKNLREIPFLKIFLVVTVNFLVCCILPFSDGELLGFDQVFSAGHIELILLAIFLYIFGVALIFDVSDVHIDSPDQKTIPQVVGVKWGNIIALAARLPLVFYLIFQSTGLVQIAFIVLFVGFQIAYKLYNKNEMFVPFFGEAILAGVGVMFLMVSA